MIGDGVEKRGALVPEVVDLVEEARLRMLDEGVGLGQVMRVDVHHHVDGQPVRYVEVPVPAPEARVVRRAGAVVVPYRAPSPAAFPFVVFAMLMVVCAAGVMASLTMVWALTAVVLVASGTLGVAAVMVWVCRGSA